MDDREFLDEIAHLEPIAVADESAHVRERTLDELDEGLKIDRLDYPRDVEPRREAAPPRTSEPEWIGAPPPRANDEGELSRGQVAWLLTGFVTLMLAGGAGAALVFHQRVADIVALFR